MNFFFTRYLYLFWNLATLPVLSRKYPHRCGKFCRFFWPRNLFERHPRLRYKPRLISTCQRFTSTLGPFLSLQGKCHLKSWLVLTRERKREKSVRGRGKRGKRSERIRRFDRRRENTAAPLTGVLAVIAFIGRFHRPPWNKWSKRQRGCCEWTAGSIPDRVLPPDRPIKPLDASVSFRRVTVNYWTVFTVDLRWRRYLLKRPLKKSLKKTLT